MMRRVKDWLVVAAVAATWIWAAAGAATADPLLKLVAADGTITQLDRDDLMALPRVSFRTTTLLTDDLREFSGVPLKALLPLVGVTAGTIRVTALNDYAVSIPVDTLTDDAPIVADLIDGAPFGVRDKGPLWIVYPYDSAPAFRTEEIYGRSVWQLVLITSE